MVKLTPPSVVDGTPVEIDVTAGLDVVGAKTTVPSDVQFSVDNPTDFRVDPIPSKPGSYILQRTAANEQASDGSETVTVTFVSASNPNVGVQVEQTFTPGPPVDLSANVTDLTPEQAQDLLNPSAGS